MEGVRDDTRFSIFWVSGVVEEYTNEGAIVGNDDGLISGIDDRLTVGSNVRVIGSMDDEFIGWLSSPNYMKKL